MTARTRQAAVCLEAAERDIRAMQTGMVLDGLHRAASQTPGAQFLQHNSALIDQWIAERRERDRSS